MRTPVILDFLRRFGRSRRANVAVTFALTLLPISLMVGMGIDVANATRLKLQLQDATDAAALGLARQAPSIADSAISSTANNLVASGYGATAFTVTSATIDRNTITATLDTKVDAPVFFSSLIGVSSIPVTAHATAKGMLLEIAVVLDTSGSMSNSAGTGGSKISALRSAGAALLDAMFGTQATSQRVSMSVVPFAASVRVVPAGSTPQPWMDTAGQSSIAGEDFDNPAKTRWSLFSQMHNVSWGGCVITRPAPYDVDDTSPSSGNPDTLFVPWFAPDEPDPAGGGWGWGWGGGGSTYANHYLDDQGGSCGGSTSGWTDAQLQARTCKYNNATPSAGKGPNYLCDSNAITPLTNSKAPLSSAISSLQANGNTNILEGLMWGWRTLSPSAPFTEGKSYTSPNNRKVVILMTDGQNYFGGTNNFNMSSYFSYGYAAKGRVGAATSNNTTLTSMLDAKTLTACTNAKAAGILIYTIAFGSGASVSQGLLKSCATDPKYFFAPQNSSDLVPVFKQIAQSINSLRIAD